MNAAWTVSEDPEMVTLRIALWNGHAVVVAAWKDNSATPFVGLCSGTAEHDLAEMDCANFRRWLDGAQGRR
jgi:hypothetical protein